MQKANADMIADYSGDGNFPPPKITSSQIEERLVRDETTEEIYMPMSSTLILKRKKEMLYVLMASKNGLTLDALVDSRA